MPETFEIRIRKEALKFASSHMTVFPDGSKEALHGHHYVPTVSLTVKEASYKKMLPFADVKAAMKKLAALWDERVLIATENPHFKLISKSRESIEFTLCKKRYLLPREETVLLKIDNVTCEALAKAYYEFLEMELDWKKDKNITSVSVYIEESPGQGAVYTHA